MQLSHHGHMVVRDNGESQGMPAKESSFETADDAEDVGERRRRRRDRRKRKNIRRSKLLYNLAWLAGGLAVGLPLLAGMLYIMSR